MNIRLYKSTMALYGDTNASIAEYLEITPQTASAKANGTNGAEFSQGEIAKLKSRGNLKPKDIDAIFFAH